MKLSKLQHIIGKFNWAEVILDPNDMDNDLLMTKSEFAVEVTKAHESVASMKEFCKEHNIVYDSDL